MFYFDQVVRHVTTGRQGNVIVYVRQPIDGRAPYVTVAWPDGVLEQVPANLIEKVVHVPHHPDDELMGRPEFDGYGPNGRFATEEEYDLWLAND